METERHPKLLALNHLVNQSRLLATSMLDQTEAFAEHHAHELSIDDQNLLFAIIAALQSQALTPEPSL